MSNKVNLDSFNILTYNGSRQPVWVGALPTKSFTNLSGQFVGGGNIRTADKDWIVKVAVTDNDDGTFTTDPFTDETALSATRWNGVDQGVKWNFYLLDARLSVIKTLYQNIVIANTLTTTTIEDAERLSFARYFPKTTSHPDFDDLNLALADLDLAPNATTLVKGKGLLDTVPVDTSNPIFVGANSPRLEKNLFSDYDNDLQGAIEEIDTDEVVLVINKPASTSSDRTLPPNIHLKFQGTGKIEIDTGTTLTIGSMEDPGSRQVFELNNNTSSVLFANGSVPHLNTAWVAGNGANADVTQAINNMIASAAYAGGVCKIYIPQIAPTTEGGHVLGSGITIIGNGNFSSGSNGVGTSLRLSKSTDYMFKVGESIYSTRWENITLDADGFTGDGVLFEGTTPMTSGDFSFQNVTFDSLTNGIHINSLDEFGEPGGSWQLAQLSFGMGVIFQACTNAAIKANSVNGQINTFGANFAVHATGKIFDFESAGLVTLIGGECVGAGAASSFMNIGGSHGCINIFGFQDENFGAYITNDASDASGIINLFGSLIQAPLDLNETCVVNLFGSNLLSHAIDGAATGAIVNDWGSYTRPLDVDGVTVVNPPVLKNATSGVRMAVEEGSNASKSVRRKPAEFISPLSDLGSPTTPVMSYGHITNGTNEDKILLRLGRMTTSEVFDFYYDVYRKHSTGWLHFDGNQTDPFKGFKFNAPVQGITNPYSGAWNGSTNFVIENDIYDKIEALIIGTLTATAAEINQLNDVSAYQESITAAGAISTTKVYSGLSLVGAGAVTLAAPSATMLGQQKVIEMILDNGDVTLSLANCEGGTAGTTCTFSAVGQKLILIAGASKWTIVKEFGVVLS